MATTLSDAVSGVVRNLFAKTAEQATGLPAETLAEMAANARGEGAYERIDNQAAKVSWLLEHGYPSKGYDDYPWLGSREQTALELAAYYDANPGSAPLGYAEMFGSVTFEDKVKLAGVPSRYWQAEHEWASAYAKDVERGESLFIYGDIGAGKTHLAVAILKELLRMGCRARFATFGGIVDEVKASFGSDDSPLDRYASVPVLVLDDLGKERPTGYVLEQLYDLVNKRNAAGLPTIVTSNYDAGELADVLMQEGGNQSTAGAIVSRLVQDAKPVRMDGPDRRFKRS